MPKAAVNSQTENVTPQYTRPCENKHSLSTPELSKKNLTQIRKTRGGPPLTYKRPFIKRVAQYIYIGHRSQFPLFYTISAIFFEKNRGIPLFFSWHFHALLSRNNAKYCKIARIINKIYNFSIFFAVQYQIY